MLQWKYKKTDYLKRTTKFSTPSSESTAALAKKIFNISQLLYHLTLPKFEPARSSVWQLQPDCWEERGSTFRFTSAGVEEKASEIFAATVLSSRAMPVAASTQWWPTREPQKTIPVVKTGEDDDAFASLKVFVSKLNRRAQRFSNIQRKAWILKTPFGTKTDHWVSTS